MKTKILQIGSGSMGTRRIRDLSAREDVEIALFELRSERRSEIERRFGIQTFDSLENALTWNPQALTISTPPDKHAPFIELALNNGLHFFSEADIWTYPHHKIESIAKSKSIVAAPSCTLYFLPTVREVKRIVQEELGTLHAYGMCLSVDAPSWHPGEGSEYYARHRATSPVREMVPFELIGLEYLFGEPREVTATVGQRGNLAIESEDTYCLQITLDNGATGQLSVFMASPQMVRKGWAVGSNGYLEFDLMSGKVSRTFAGLGLTDTRHFGGLGDVIEATYATEMNTFIEAIQGKTKWPFPYFKGAIVTGALAAAEKSALTGQREPVEPAITPAALPDQYLQNEPPKLQLADLGMFNGISQSDSFWQRAQTLVPCGTQCLSKGPSQFVDGFAPKYLRRGEGCIVEDVDGNRLLDYGMGLGAVSLGYNYPSVNAAIVEQLQDASILTLMHPLEVEVAELVRGVVPCAEAVRFAKNGSDVTSAAVRLARAYTQRDIVLCCGYHGWHDWYVITTERTAGIPAVMDTLTKKFAYNDIESLRTLLEAYKDRVAAVIMEPIGVVQPHENFLADVRELTHQHGALLIFDEVLTGFRLNIGGAQALFGVTPDLATFGKAVANGMPLSILAGRADVMAKLQDVFFSFTFGGEMLSLAAAKATINEMRDKDTIAHITTMGRTLQERGNAIIAKHGIADLLGIKGPDAKSIFWYGERPDAMLIKSFLQQEMMRRGILFTSYHYLSYSHKAEHIAFTLDALDDSLCELTAALRVGNIEQRLEGKAVAPVFRKP